MENNFQLIFQAYLSSDNNIRIQAENKINEIVLKDDANNLDILYYYLCDSNSNNQIKLFIALLLKKIFENIQDKNLNNYRNYIRNKLNNIVNAILKSNNDIKTANILVLSLSKAIEIFDTDNNQNEHIKIFMEIFTIIFTFYNENKINNNNYKKTFLSLFVLFKLLKYIQLDLTELTESFYQFGDIIIDDFSKIVKCLFNSNNNDSIEIFIEYIILYLKMSKYFINNIKPNQSEKIMNIVYDLITQILNQLIQSNDNLNKINVSISTSKFMFDIICLSNKILLKYISLIDNVDLNIIKKYIQLFYVYIKDESIFQKILLMLKNNIHEYSSNTNNDYKLTKFTVDIIDFFRECVSITTYSNYEDLIYFKGIFSDNSIKISDFLNSEFFIDIVNQQIILFTIKYALTFKISEFEMGKNNPEEFYIWYDSLTTFYDLREKGYALIRTIFMKNKKEIRNFFEILENELINLINKENNLLNQGKNLSIDEINLKCAILSCFESIASYYFNKKVDFNKWLNQILLNQLKNNNILIGEFFSKFIIIRILNTFFDYKEVQKYKNEIFSIIFNLFINVNINSYQIILSFVSIDFFFNFFEEMNDNSEIPNNFLLNYIQKICNILQVTSNPEIHSKIIQVSRTILMKYKEEDISSTFPIIFPKIKNLWYNNWNEYNQTLENLQNITITTLHSKFNNKNYNKEKKVYNEIGIVRQNLIKLISLFVEKIGILVSFNNQNNNVDDEYFNFIYNVIGYSINIKSSDSTFLISDGFNLIFLIIDEFYDSSPLNTVQKISELKNPIENSIYFPYFSKIFDYLKIILDNLYFSQEYMIPQLFLLEELFSFTFIPIIGIYFDNENFIIKIIYLLENIIGNYILEYHQIIINFMEYILIITNLYSTIKQENKKLYNDYIYQYILKIFEKISELEIKNIIQSKIELQKENEYNKIIEENNQLILFICGIQLSNILIKLNFLNNNDLIQFIGNLSSKILCIYDYLQKENIFLNCLQKDIILETTKNIFIILNEKKYDYLKFVSINNLKQKIFIKKESYFLNKIDKALSNHLFFFNKIFNKNLYYNLSLEEDDLKKIWFSKCEKMGMTLNIINYKIKFYFMKEN